MGDTQVRPLRLAVIALFVLSAIGLLTVEPDPEAGGVFVTAASATERAGSAAFSMEATFQVTGDPVVAAGEGRIDFSDGDGTAMWHTPPTEMILHDGIMYTRLQGQPKWLAVESKKHNRDLPVVGAGMTQTEPLAALDALQRGGIVRNVQEEGREDVRGVSTARHGADVDPEKLLAGAEPEVIRSLGIRSLRYTVWVDDDGLLRRFQVAMQGTYSARMTMELYDFGIPVTVEPPPADQVERLPKR